MSSGVNETKKRILSATLKLLEDSQGKSIRMSDIAKLAGISRQALYLHYKTRAELLSAATHYLDDIKDSHNRLVPSRQAKTGVERLDFYIEAWGNYIPEIYGVARALLAMRDTDQAAKSSFDERMQDMREGCEAAILALKKDGMLNSDYSAEQATDILWTMLSIRNWEQLTIECGWSHKKYIKIQKKLAYNLFVNDRMHSLIPDETQ